jgi:protein arginine kinase
MTLHPEFSSLLKTAPFWNEVTQPNTIACGIRLMRNLQHFAFVSKLEPQAKAQILKFIASALKECPILHSIKLIEAKEASGEDKELLIERFPFLEGINQANQNEVFAFDSTGRFLALINLKEHLELHFVAPGEKLDELLTKAAEIESCLGKSLEFAFHQRFGFLSADPRQCGTALVANVILHLPALIQTGTFETLIKQHLQGNILINGIQPIGFSADLVLLQNNQTIGFTEETIISELQSLVSRLVVAESSLCRKLQETPDPQLMDKVSRAFGLLRHSYLLDTIESMQALSLVKLGIELHWIEGISFDQIHQLLMGSQRLHLKMQTTLDIEQNINHERATCLHEAMSSGHLTI